MTTDTDKFDDIEHAIDSAFDIEEYDNELQAMLDCDTQLHNQIYSYQRVKRSIDTIFHLKTVADNNIFDNALLTFINSNGSLSKLLDKPLDEVLTNQVFLESYDDVLHKILGSLIKFARDLLKSMVEFFKAYFVFIKKADINLKANLKFLSSIPAEQHDRLKKCKITFIELPIFYNAIINLNKFIVRCSTVDLKKLHLFVDSGFSGTVPDVSQYQMLSDQQLGKDYQKICDEFGLIIDEANKTITYESIFSKATEGLFVDTFKYDVPKIIMLSEQVDKSIIEKGKALANNLDKIEALIKKLNDASHKLPNVSNVDSIKVVIDQLPKELVSYVSLIRKVITIIAEYGTKRSELVHLAVKAIKTTII